MTGYIVFHAYCVYHNFSFIRYCAKQDPMIWHNLTSLSDSAFMVSIRAVLFIITLAPLTFLALLRHNKDLLDFILDCIFKEAK